MGFSNCFQRIALSALCLAVVVTNAYMVGNNPKRRAAFLDPQQKYHLQWTVDLEQKQIFFNVTVKTGGWVLFGLANNNEDRTGKDVVVGGVLGQSGKPFMSDRHEKGNNRRKPAVRDKIQNYKLEGGWEKDGVTFLSFSRSLNTCDNEDYPITLNKVTLMWGYAYGEDDIYDNSFEFGERGSYEEYLLDPEHAPRIVRDAAGTPQLLDGPDDPNLKVWTISTRINMPTEHTSYVCTIHKAPRLRYKHHIIGYEVHFPNPESRQHTHHFTLYRCNAPSGYHARSIFEPFVGSSGTSCFLVGKPPTDPRGQPNHLCNQLYVGYAIGNRAFFLPPEAGMPLGTDLDEYYLVQSHYDNPQNLENVEVSVRMDLWYTPNVRPNDGRMMAVGLVLAGPPPTILVPPRSTNHRVLGYCSAECTKRMFPEEGISVFASLLHSHNSGKRMRVRHFDMEKKVELPWIIYDDNYQNTFQPVRMLQQPARILPGDQITLECTYDNTWTNGSVHQGYSTAQEMCLAYLFHYSSIPNYSFCRSEIASESARRRFLSGLENATWSDEHIDWVALSPDRLAGHTLTEIGDGVKWDFRLRTELQKYHETMPQLASCSKDLYPRDTESFAQSLEARRRIPIVYPPMHVDTSDDYSSLVGYPFAAKPYIPKDNACSTLSRSASALASCDKTNLISFSNDGSGWTSHLRFASGNLNSGCPNVLSAFCLSKDLESLDFT